VVSDEGGEGEGDDCEQADAEGQDKQQDPTPSGHCWVNTAGGIGIPEGEVWGDKKEKLRLGCETELCR
jgi:hypothetical protein